MTAGGELSGPRRFAVALTANAGMFVFGVVLLLMGALLPSLRVNNAQAGSLGAFPLAGIWMATVVIGPFLDLWGSKPALVLALIVTAVPLAVLSCLHNYAEMAGAAFAYGLGGGLLNTTTNVLIAELQAEGRAAALNLLGFSFSLGALAAPLLMSSVARLSPAAVIRILAGLTIAILIPVSFVRFPPPQRAGARLGELLSALRQPLVWVFGMMLLFESGSENCMFVWSAKVLKDLFHIVASRANLALVALTAALGIGRLVAAAAGKRLDGRMLLVICAALEGFGAILAAIGATAPAMIAGLIVIGFGMSAIYPTALGVAGDIFPQDAGTVLGAVMAVSLVGGVAGPKLGGLLAALGPRQILWIPLVTAAAVAALAIWMGAGAGKGALRGA